MKPVSYMDADARFREGLALHHKGLLAPAQELYRQVLTLQPRHFEALHLLGVIAAQSNDHARAVELIGKAIEITPGSAMAHYNLGNALNALGHYQAAIASYDKAIALKPDYAGAHGKRGAALNNLNQQRATAETHCSRGNTLLGLKQYHAAIENYDKAIAIWPDAVAAHINRGVALNDLEQYQAAISSYDKAIALWPEASEAHFNRGFALYALKRYQDALDSYDKAIAIKPDFALAYFNRSIALHALEQYQAAVESNDKAIAIKPDYAEAYYNRGNTLLKLKQYQGAVASYDKALAIKPDYAEALSSRGVALSNLKQYQDAIDSYDRAIAAAPDYAEGHWNQSLCYLQMGNFEQGWSKYEWRWKNAKLGSQKIWRDFPQPLWLGAESLQDKTILLHSEQGLGDTIQFCRYAKLVSRLGARVVLEVQRPLAGLLAGLEGVAELVMAGDKLPAFDFHCPLMSLPLAFRTGLDTIPAPDTYIASDPGKLAQWKAKLGSTNKPRVGLVWSGSSTHTNDANRSVALSEFVKHLPRNFAYFSLQKELRQTDPETLKSHPEVFHFGDELKDFTDTAALCELIDVVISVDTSVAHLAGALGKPVWIALPFNPDWRWLLDRTDSPWYPSARLYRQEAPGDWQGVFARVAADLERVLKFR